MRTHLTSVLRPPCALEPGAHLLARCLRTHARGRRGTAFDHRALLSVLRHCPKLQVLEAEQCWVTGDGLGASSSATGGDGGDDTTSPALPAPPLVHRALDTLNLDMQGVEMNLPPPEPDARNPPLGDRGVQLLSLMLPNLVSFSLRDSALGDGGWLALGAALPRLRHLQVSAVLGGWARQGRRCS